MARTVESRTDSVNEFGHRQRVTIETLANNKTMIVTDDVIHDFGDGVTIVRRKVWSNDHDTTVTLGLEKDWVRWTGDFTGSHLEKLVEKATALDYRGAPARDFIIQTKGRGLLTLANA